ncbi:THO complex subunit 7 homolog isoform X1 [Euwallacea fornicatus]|uniref:THO complex subunit 7 homolog isoform X1 n=2 Tax=Euwallacea fornicatus TaxID=995702 RepID=UPI00338F0F2A
MSEEEVIKRRLIFDGDGTGEDRRLNVIVKMMSKWIHTTDETPEEAQITCNKISAQLALVKHSRRRSDLVHNQNAKQLENYKSLHSDMKSNIAEKKTEIANQKEELENAKIVKQNRIQYDLLAKAIEKEPPRTDTNKNLKALQKELADLAAEKKELEQEILAREKQFSVLTTSANSLAALLSEGNKSSRRSAKENSGSDPEPMSE